MTAAIAGSGRAIAILLAISLSAAACGEAAIDEAADADARADAAAEVTASTGQAGSFQMGGVTYPFTVTNCDLTGEIYGGMVVQGAGTTPDGRRLAISVDRTGSDMITENAFVSFGRIAEADVWSASRTGLRDGRWFMDEAATEPADRRLIEPSGNVLVIEATFHREIDGSSAPGVLRASC